MTNLSECKKCNHEPICMIKDEYERAVNDLTKYPASNFVQIRVGCEYWDQQKGNVR